MKKSFGLIAVVVAAGLASGCATGRTDFRVIRMPPTPEAGSVADVPGAIYDRGGPEAGSVADVPGAPEADSGSFAAVPAAPAVSVGDLVVDPQQQPMVAGPGAPAAAGPVKIEPATYTVRPGESLWRISRKLLGNPEKYRTLARANRIVKPDLIHPGQILILPETQPAVAPNPPQAAIEKAAAAPAVRPNPAAAKPAALPAAKPAAGMVCPIRPNLSFRPGEQLKFSVEYFGIAAGYATLSVHEGPKINDRPTYHLVAEARTHPAFEWFYKVRDRIESFFDSQGLFSWRYEKHLREGNYSNDSEMTYDQFQQRVIMDQGRKIVPAPAWTQDILSEFYYFRTLNYKIGDELQIPVVADDGKTYDLRVKVLRKERISVPAGSFDCVVVEPYLLFEGLFKHKGKLHIWITDDARKVPVLIKSEIVIGSINIVLRDATVVEF